MNKKFRTTGSRLQIIGQTILGVLLMLIFYFIFFFSFLVNTINLKNNGIEINGKTVRWVYMDDYRMVEYSFISDGHVFKITSEIIYYGREIEGIVCPGGEYVVIYEKDNPDNSIMDFKRPAK